MERKQQQCLQCLSCKALHSASALEKILYWRSKYLLQVHILLSLYQHFLLLEILKEREKSLF